MIFIKSIINTERNIPHRKETWEGEFSKEKAIMIEIRKERESSETDNNSNSQVKGLQYC